MSRPPEHVVLLGLMGAGKTTVGRELARALGWPLSDSDEVIAREQGATVRELGERLGTERMHQLEAEHLRRALASGTPSVIAAAASVVELPQCREALQQDGVYPVWLRGRAETLAERFARQPHRPLLERDTEQLLRHQVRERSRWFSGVARQQLSTDERTPEQLTREILRALAEQSSGAGHDHA